MENGKKVKDPFFTHLQIYIKWVFFTILGPDLPERLSAHSIIELEGDLYVIGGFDGNIVKKSIHRLQCSSSDCKWTTMRQELEIRRSYPVAIPVLDSFTTCNWSFLIWNWDKMVSLC